MTRTSSRSVSTLRETLAYLHRHIDQPPSIAIILGSGLGEFGNRLRDKIVVPTESIPHYPRLTVEGHRGKLIFGKIGNVQVLTFQGRIHFYESNDLAQVLFPIQVASGIGIKTLLVTNAAGGINRQFRPGDFMLITDQINLSFELPLLPKQFQHKRNQHSRSQVYNSRIQGIIAAVAAEKSIPLRRGVYCGVKGPSYETAAEIEMIRKIGGDAVGMSTVNEVSLAKHLGMRVAGISCITNLATGMASVPLSHAEVTEVANKVKKRFEVLIREIIKTL